MPAFFGAPKPIVVLQAISVGRDVSAAASPHDLRLVQGKTISGRIAGLRSKLRNARMRVTLEGTTLSVEGPIDEDGWFETPSLPPGRYVLTVARARGRFASPGPVFAGTRHVIIEATTR